MLYEHLPEELPKAWVPATYSSATHYLAHFLFNEKTEFADVFRYYLALKDSDTSLVAACSHPPRNIPATKKEEKDGLMRRRAVFMGAGINETGWDARIRSWIGLKDKGPDGQFQFNQKLMPIKRESMEDLLWKLGLSSIELPRDGWCARKPYHRTEAQWRSGESTLPTKLPKIAMERLLKPLKEENPELRNLTQKELAGVLFLLRANPPYSMSRNHNLEDLSPEQRERIEREDHLQKTRVITQYLAAAEERAMEMLRKILEGQDLENN